MGRGRQKSQKKQGCSKTLLHWEKQITVQQNNNNFTTFTSPWKKHAYCLSIKDSWAHKSICNMKKIRTNTKRAYFEGVNRVTTTK